MRKSRLHWWILLGILVGSVVGTFLNATSYPEIAREAREIVFDGESYDAADAAARMKAIQAEEKRLFRETLLGGAIDGIARLFLTLQIFKVRSV